MRSLALAAGEGAPLTDFKARVAAEIEDQPKEGAAALSTLLLRAVARRVSMGEAPKVSAFSDEMVEMPHARSSRLCTCHTPPLHGYVLTPPCAHLGERAL